MQQVDAALHLLKHAAVRTKAGFPKPSLKLTLYLDDLVGGRHHVSSERGEARTLHSHEAAVQTDKGPYLSTVAETVADNVGEQMKPLLVLLKQAQDHSEVLEQRCHDLEARQSVFQERAIQISSRHFGCRAGIPAKILGLPGDFENQRGHQSAFHACRCAARSGSHWKPRPFRAQAIEKRKKTTWASSNGAW